MRVLSLGAGVQSSTLLLMACEGELEIDATIFADTQWEPAAVYTFHRVTAGNIREITLGAAGRRYAPLPLYVQQSSGEQGIGRRQCTKEYKLRPIQRLIRSWDATAAKPVDMLIGISLDEYTRMADSRVQYVRSDMGIPNPSSRRVSDAHIDGIANGGS